MKLLAGLSVVVIALLVLIWLQMREEPAAPVAEKPTVQPVVTVAKADQSFLIVIFLIAQVSAVVGALVFERIARKIGSKWAILLSLAIWSGIVIYAYAFLADRRQAMFMAAAIGSVLGAAQALSRSLYSKMIPIGRESAFFGLYEISEKGTSWMGQLLFAIIISATGSFRQAILGLIVFFVVGIVVLLFTDTNRAIREAGNHPPEVTPS